MSQFTEKIGPSALGHNIEEFPHIYNIENKKDLYFLNMNKIPNLEIIQNNFFRVFLNIIQRSSNEQTLFVLK